jgi:carboxyl-terminal processing protease
VRGVLEGSPAALAGVAPGERLVALDGQPFEPVKPFLARVGRPTRLTLQWDRDPATQRELVLVPESISPRALFLRALRASARIVEREGRRLGYAHLWSYAGEELHEALRALLLEGVLAEAEGLVLDLRGGFGGASLEYLNLFRLDLPTLELEGRSGAVQVLASSWKKPVVLLVDEGTTSGKELFAHVFQRQGRGPVVGVRTAGAVLGGRAFLLADGTLLYLAVSDVRIDGTRLEGVGVTPDVLVPWERVRSPGDDRQQQRAFAVLRELLGDP